MLERVTCGTVLAALLAVMALAASSIVAQSAPVWPVAIDEAVEALLADEWDIPADDVVLEWGATGSAIPAENASVELTGSGAGGHWVVRVAEPGGRSMSVRLRAGHVTTEPVAARRLDRGVTLTSDDIRPTESFDWGPPRRTGESVREGWVVQRRLDEGDPLVEPAVRAPLMVTSGSAIDVVWQSGAVRVRLPGKAAGSGGLGDEIRVRTGNGKRMSGVIVAPGVVDVTRSAARSTVGGAL